MHRTFRMTVVSVLLAGITAFAQTSSASDPNAVMAAAIAAFSSAPVHSIQLSGTVHAIAGTTNETGTFTFSLDATGASQLQLNLNTLTRKETTGAFSSGPQCTWSGPDGVQHPVANHNCWLPVQWVVPILGLQNATFPLVPEVSAGIDSDGSALQILTVHCNVSSRSAGKWIARFSRVSFSLDVTTFLTKSVKFNQHPDRDSFTDVPIVVRYSNYRQVSGVTLPFQIQKYLNNGLVLDLQISAATVQ